MLSDQKVLWHIIIFVYTYEISVTLIRKCNTHFVSFHLAHSRTSFPNRLLQYSYLCPHFWKICFHKFGSKTLTYNVGLISYAAFSTHNQCRWEKIRGGREFQDGYSRNSWSKKAIGYLKGSFSKKYLWTYKYFFLKSNNKILHLLLGNNRYYNTYYY